MLLNQSIMMLSNPKAKWMKRLLVKWAVWVWSQQSSIGLYATSYARWLDLAFSCRNKKVLGCAFYGWTYLDQNVPLLTQQSCFGACQLRKDGCFEVAVKLSEFTMFSRKVSCGYFGLKWAKNKIFWRNRQYRKIKWDICKSIRITKNSCAVSYSIVLGLKTL